MPKDLAMPIETLIGQSVRPRSCLAEPAAPRQMPAAAKRSGRRQGEGLPTPVKMADRLALATQLSQVRSISPSGQGVPCRFLPCAARTGFYIRTFRDACVRRADVFPVEKLLAKKQKRA